MTWVLKSPGGVTLLKRVPLSTQEALNPFFLGSANRVVMVRMVFLQLDDNGAAVTPNGDVLIQYDANGLPIASQTLPDGWHVYTEPNVPDVSPQNIARLVGDQLAALNRVEAATLGAAADDHVAAVAALAATPSNLTAAQLSAVKAAGDFTEPNNQAIADALNGADVANPVTVAPKIDPTITAPALLALLTTDEQKAVVASTSMPDISNKIQYGQIEPLRNFALAMEATGAISSESYTAVTNALAQIDDPSWTSTVKQSVALVGRPLTAADIALARVAG